MDLTPKQRAEIRRKKAKAEEKAKGPSATTAPAKAEVAQGPNEGNKNMNTGIKAWWNRKSQSSKRTTLQIISTIVGVLAAIGPITMFVVTLYGWATQSKPVFGAVAGANIFQEGKIKQEVVEKVKGYETCVTVAVYNPTVKKIKSAAVIYPKKGYFALNDSEGRMVAFGEYKGRVDIQDIPAETLYAVNIWHNGPLEKAKDKIVGITEEGGKVTLPYVEAEHLVPKMYQSGFWGVTACFVILVVINVSMWLKRQLLGDGGRPAGTTRQTAANSAQPTAAGAK